MARVGRSRPSNDSERVRFVKIVIRKSLRHKRLMLPKSFTRVYWRHAPTRATLFLPGHRRWEMEVFKDENGRVWLQKSGWEAFADFYSLQHGYILLFTYLGGSEFFVRVYSKGSLEIKYPPPPAEEEETTEEQEEEEDDDDDDEDFEELPAKHVHRRGQNSSSREHAEFPVFVATLSASMFYQAHIPAKFSKKYIAESDACVILKMGNKAWDVNLNRQGGKIRYPKLSSGWVQFAGDNSLMVGDKCVFRLVKKVPVLVFEVAIVKSPVLKLLL